MVKKLKYFFIILVIFIIDLILKYSLFNNHRAIINTNTGIGLGLLPNNFILILGLSIIIIGVFIALLLRKKSFTKYNNLEKFSLSIIIAGSLNNLFDRLFYGFVIDYIRMPLIPMFNISDFSITLGIIMLIILLLRA